MSTAAPAGPEAGASSDDGLRQVGPDRSGVTPRRYVALIWAWTKQDFETKYRRSALQVLWALLQPILFVATYVFVFGVIFDATGGDLPYLTYLLSGVIVLRVVTAAISANTCLGDNYNLISHSYFPREVIPLSRVTGGSLDLAVTTSTLIVVAAFQHVSMRHISIVVVPLILLSVLMLASAVCIALSTIQVFVKDLQFAAVPLGQILFFASPISYVSDQLPDNLRWLDWANPISVNVEALRDAAFRGLWPDWQLFGIHFALSALLLVAAIAHLRSIQHRIVDLG